MTISFKAFELRSSRARASSYLRASPRSSVRSRRVLLAGCGTLPASAASTATSALAARARQPAGEDRQGVDSARREDQSGFRLMPLGALLARRADRAGAAGDALARRPVLPVRERQDRPPAAARAARRRDPRRAGAPAGRRPLHDRRRRAVRGLAAFPNVEVRLFNPFCCGRGGGVVAKYVASLADFGRLNHRMHNKLFIADGAMAVTGGRNIADEYFMRGVDGQLRRHGCVHRGRGGAAARRHLRPLLEQRARLPDRRLIGEPLGDEEARQKRFDELIDDQATR